jgi:D-glycero-alpha-D-manno-heptose 1-phosphate guanylyltransferase
MEAVVLAGGFGTRLRSLINGLPKPMAPVRNKPFLEYILDWLSEYNIRRIVISVGYKPESIISYFGHDFHGIPIEYAMEEKPLGTGGGIMNSITHVQENNIVVLNGDTYFPVDLDALISSHKRFMGKVTIALKKMTQAGRYGTVIMNEDDGIVQFHEKSLREIGLINGGIYVIRKSFLKEMDLPESFSFEKDILEKYADGTSLKGVVFEDPFIDIGIPEDYIKAGEVL